MPLKSNNELNLFSLKKYSNALRVPALPRQVAKGGCDRGQVGQNLFGINFCCLLTQNEDGGICMRVRLRPVENYSLSKVEEFENDRNL